MHHFLFLICVFKIILNVVCIPIVCDLYLWVHMYLHIWHSFLFYHFSMYLLTHIPSHFSAAAVASCGTVWPVWGGRPSLYSTAWSAGSHCSRGPSYRTAETPLQTTGEKQSENRRQWCKFWISFRVFISFLS